MKVFEKRNQTDLIYWVFDTEKIGLMEFSFDKKKIYNFYKDYPQNLTADELALFNKENPLLVEMAGV